jgi:succinate dehydrogenase / fumarate reductase cytochrome b subunit
MPNPETTRAAIRRIHSVTGMVPVAAFLIAHFSVNAVAVRGPQAFDRAAVALDRLPFLPLVEWGLIALPLALHLALGVWLLATDDVEPPPRTRAETWQRGTGIALAFFVIYHVWATRLSPQIVGGSSERFAFMARHLEPPGVLAVYALAVLAASYHLGHGVVAFAARWGLARGRAHATVRRAGVAVFVIAAWLGLNALLAFRLPAARWLEPPW